MIKLLLMLTAVAAAVGCCSCYLQQLTAETDCSCLKFPLRSLGRQIIIIKLLLLLTAVAAAIGCCNWCQL